MINVNGREIETDAEGYLATLDDWTEDVAKCLAERDQLDLADEHWKVVRWIREYYAENGTAPNLRVMSKLIGGALGNNTATKYLFDLFPTAPPAGRALRRHAEADRLRLK
jgi:tRNA 2-thiouridine synthesizing protein E